MERLSNRHEGDLDGKLLSFDPEKALAVTVIVEPEAAKTPAGQHTAWMLLNLLARLEGSVKSISLCAPDGVPQIGRIVPLAPRDLDLKGALSEGANAIGGVPVSCGESRGFTLTVGSSDRSSDLYVAGNAWCGGISKNPISIPLSSSLPFGPYVAATLAAGEVFRKSRIQPSEYRDVRSVFYSTWFHRSSSSMIQGGPEALPAIDLNVALGGAGAVGSTFLHCLWAIPGLRGVVLVADSDEKGVDKTNLNRCPIFSLKSLGEKKAPEAARVLFDAEFKLDPHSKMLQELELSSKNQYVVSAVDKNVSREAIQKSFYPARLFSASTRDLRAEVMRCGPPGFGPCLRCHNPIPLSTPDADLRQQLKEGPSEELQKICSETGVEEADAKTWIESGACGQTGDRILEFLRRSEEEPVQFSVGFVSVLAGTLLAAEVLKDHFAVDAPLSDSVQRAVFQFMNPESERNRASPYQRDPNCPLCIPDSVATGIWKKRFRQVPHQRP